jgi:hypothetical protein
MIQGSETLGERVSLSATGQQGMWTSNVAAPGSRQEITGAGPLLPSPSDTLSLLPRRALLARTLVAGVMLLETLSRCGLRSGELVPVFLFCSVPTSRWYVVCRCTCAEVHVAVQVQICVGHREGC